MIDSFTLEQFTAALPRHKSNNQPLSISLGISNGEYCFLLPVGQLTSSSTGLKQQPGIFIRSTVGASEVSAPTGEDSIRIWIVRATLDQNTRQWFTAPLGTRDNARWITRVPGWEGRLEKSLRRLYKLALHIRPCRTCGDLLAVVKIRRGPNKGKYALGCKNQNCAGEFRIITEAA